jgi:hypothetical protein
MNERIRELAEQAVQLVADEHTKGDVSRLNTDAYHVKDLINEKFAELIVRETTNAIIKGHKGHINPALARESANKHFGVEE